MVLYFACKAASVLRTCSRPTGWQWHRRPGRLGAEEDGCGVSVTAQLQHRGQHIPKPRFFRMSLVSLCPACVASIISDSSSFGVQPNIGTDSAHEAAWRSQFVMSMVLSGGGGPGLTTHFCARRRPPAASARPRDGLDGDRNSAPPLQPTHQSASTHVHDAVRLLPCQLHIVDARPWRRPPRSASGCPRPRPWVRPP